MELSNNRRCKRRCFVPEMIAILGNSKLGLLGLSFQLLIVTASCQRQSQMSHDVNEDFVKDRSAELERKIAEAYERNDWQAAERCMAETCTLNPRDAHKWGRLATYRAFIIPTFHDDFRDRYEWRKRGVEALLDGLSANPDDRDLAYDAGWQLRILGTADERAQFRKLFAADTQFHAVLADHIDAENIYGANHIADNFLAARLLFIKATKLPDGHNEIRFPTEIPTAPTRCLVNYAEVLQDEGRVAEAVAVWRQADTEWRALAKKLDQADRELTNLEYWIGRCKWEQEEAVVAGRTSLSDFRRLRDEQHLDPLSYERLFQMWGVAIDRHSELLEEEELVRELWAVIQEYFQLIDAPVPPDFLLMPVIKRYDEGFDGLTGWSNEELIDDHQLLDDHQFVVPHVEWRGDGDDDIGGPGAKFEGGVKFRDDESAGGSHFRAEEPQWPEQP